MIYTVLVVPGTVLMVVYPTAIMYGSVQVTNKVHN